MLKSKRAKIILSIFLAVCLAVSLIVTLAVFTDRVSHQMKFSAAIFAADGYELERVAPIGPFIAGEDIEVTIKESNTGSRDIKSVITMSTKWTSPDTSLSVFGNANAEDNATLTIDGEDVSYDVNDDGTITFALPEHLLAIGANEQARKLVFHIPDSFKSTGDLSFTFDKVKVDQSPSGFSEEFTHDELNASEELDFAVRVGWAASALSDTDATPNGHKALMGYLTEKDEKNEYGIEFRFEFNYDKSAMRDFASKTEAKWSYYKDTVNRLTFVEGMTTIGDYVFPDFEKVTAITLPESITAVGTWAFDNTSITELTVPEKVATFETMSFGHINELTEITFNGSTGKDITFPEKAGADTGAFYVYPYVDTKINGTNTDALAYDWIKDLRNPPMLDESNDWYADGATQSFSSLTTMRFISDPSEIPESYDTSWNAAVDRDGDGENDDDIICYLNGTELTIYGNTATRIYANPMSERAFCGSSTETIENLTMLDTSKVEDASYMFAYSSYVNLDVSNFDTSNIKDMSCLFYLNYYMENLDFSGWDTGNVEDMDHMFSDCEALTDLSSLQGWDTRNVITFNNMFRGVCSVESMDLRSIEVTLAPNAANPEGKTYDSWDTGNAKDMQYMFGNNDDASHALKSLYISTFDTRNVIDMQSMFENSFSLESIDLTPNKVTLNGETFYAWDTANCESMYMMFKDCTRLTSLDLSGWDTVGIGTGENLSEDDFQEMFYGCTALETLNVSRKSMTGINGRNYTSWNTSNAEHMDDMFNSCSVLKSLDLSNWNNKNVTDMGGMFANCSSMTSINLTNFTTPSLNYASTMFFNCSSLSEIDVSSFDTSNLAYMINMFGNCTGLDTLDLSNFVTTGLEYSRYFAWFAKGCTSLKTIILNENFGQEGMLPSAGSSNGLFYVGTPYSSNEPLRTKVIGANDVMQNYAWEKDNRGYKVTVNNVTGGTITTSSGIGMNGKTITITDTPNNTPNNRYIYDGATVSYTLNGTAGKIELDGNTRTFVMPAADVVVTPKWKKDNTIYITLKYLDDITPDETIKYTGQELPAPTNGDYKFGGWYVGDSEDVVTSLDFTTLTENYPWTQDANGVWSSGNAGVKSSTSDMISEEFTIPFGGGTLSFDWRSNGESGFDYIGYDILNVTTGEYLSGKTTPTYKYGNNLGNTSGNPSTSFTTMTKELEEGTYQILFMYGKDGGTDKNEDKGFVKNVQVSYINWFCTDQAFSGTATDGMILAAKWKLKALTGIEVAVQPTKTHYKPGQDFETAGLVLKVTYSDGTSEYINEGYTVVDGTALAGGKTEVTISYTEDGVTKTTTVPITVVTPPTLAASYTWAKGRTDSSSISMIQIVDKADETTIASATESWPAAVDADGDGALDDDIMCYVNGTTLTIAGNGAGKILANPDSSHAFSARYISGLRISTITGLDVLDTSNVTDMSYMFYITGTISELDLSSFNTKNVKTMAGMFNLTGYAQSGGVVLNISQKTFNVGTSDEYVSWNTANVETMKGMFAGDRYIHSLDVSHFDTSNVTDMHNMFSGCYALKELDVSKFNTSKVTNMNGMFKDCTKLTKLDLSNFDTRSITSSEGLNKFAYSCGSLTTIYLGPNFGQSATLPPAGGDADDVDTCNGLFYLENLKETTVFNANNVLRNYDWVADNRDVAFDGLTNTLASGFSWYKGSTKKNTITTINIVDSANATTKSSATESWAADVDGNGSIMCYVNGTTLTIAGNGAGKIMANPNSSYAFSGTSNATRFSSVTAINGLELLNTSKATDMSHMFANCASVEELDVSKFNTSKVTNMNGMFNGCSKIGSLDLSSFDTTAIEDRQLYRFAAHCNSLGTIILGENFGQAETVYMTGNYYHSVFGYYRTALNGIDHYTRGTTVYNANDFMKNEYSWNTSGTENRDYRIVTFKTGTSTLSLNVNNGSVKSHSVE